MDLVLFHSPIHTLDLNSGLILMETNLSTLTGTPVIFSLLKELNLDSQDPDHSLIVHHSGVSLLLGMTILGRTGHNS